MGRPKSQKKGKSYKSERSLQKTNAIYNRKESIIFWVESII